MYVHMYVCTYVHMYTVHVRMYSHQIPEPVEDHSSYHREPVPIGQYKRMDVQKVGRYIHMYVCKYVVMYASTHICLYVCTYVCMYVYSIHMYVRMNTCEHVYQFL